MTKSAEPSTPSGSSETQQRRRQITSYKNTTTSPATDSPTPEGSIARARHGELFGIIQDHVCLTDPCIDFCRGEAAAEIYSERRSHDLTVIATHEHSPPNKRKLSGGCLYDVASAIRHFDDRGGGGDGLANGQGSAVEADDCRCAGAFVEGGVRGLEMGPRHEAADARAVRRR